MKLLYVFAVTLAMCSCVNAKNEILAILDSATDLTPRELNLLQHIFRELQKQYDHIKLESEKTPVPYANPISNPTIDAAAIADYQAQMTTLLPQLDATSDLNYETKLPTVEELIGVPNTEGLTIEQINEIHDLQSILQETLDETQAQMDEFMQRSRTIHANLLKINKPKIIMYIYRALGMIYGIAGRVGRAAYCTYYYGPQLNDSLHDVYDGIECWQYTKSLVIRIETQTVQTLATFKRNALELAGVYKKLAGKKSLLGKIITGVLNMQKILRNVQESYASAMQALDDVQNELPQAGINALKCGIDFAVTLPHLQDVITHLTACILFVDDTTPEYEFMKPEAERNWFE